MAPLYQLAGKRVWVAGMNGMVGTAIVRRLADAGCTLLESRRETLDLLRQDAVEAWMQAHRPQAVFLAAARVGGIHANNTLPANFLYENLAIATNIIETAHRIGVEKLLYLGSSCIYPRLAPQPMSESDLLTGPLEPTNEAYAISKIAGMMLCKAYRRQHGRDFISLMPTNLYGPNDKFNDQHGHVPAALLSRFQAAKEDGARQVEVWGSGAARREFMHVDDLADGAVFLMEHYSDETSINVGTGHDITIAAFAEKIRRVVGFEGEIVYNRSRPDGVPRKLLDCSRMRALGWAPKIDLDNGLAGTHAWYLAHRHDARR